MEIATSSPAVPPPATQEAIAARVARDATRIYGDTIAAETLADWASSAVAELWGDSVRVTTFLPVLALRMVSHRAASHTDLSDAAG